MDDQSLLERIGFNSNTRLSESRLKFKPVLVKKLLANESDDDSDDPSPNSENSGEESDFDDFQPLPDESFKENKCQNDSFSKEAESKDEESTCLVEEKQIPQECCLKKLEEVTDSQSALSSSLKSSHISEKPVISPPSPTIKIEEPAEKNISQASSICRIESLSVKTNSDFQSKSQTPNQYNQNSNYKIKGKHRFEQPIEIKDGLQSSQFPFPNSDLQAYQMNKQYSTNANSEQIQNSISHLSNSSHNLNTPIKSMPNTSYRPTPCLSQRNIYQTPQSKLCDKDFSKSSLQTPATIFSHWSQQHLSQTPMQNQMLHSRESLKTPAGNVQSQSSRYYNTEAKSARKPLSETMHASTSHGSHLPRLEEVPSEFESNQMKLVSRENINYNENKPLSDNVKGNWNQKFLSVNKIDGEINMNKNKQILPSMENNQLPVRKYEKNHVHLEQNIHHQPLHHKQNEKLPNPIKSDNYAIASNAKRNVREYKFITVKNRQYLNLGTIGQGMSCEVVRVQDCISSELRAIKCVDLTKMDAEQGKGCLQEITMLHKLQAPCIVKMFDFEILKNSIYVIMEIGDTDLSRLLKSMFQEKKKLPLSMILYYWTEMLTAVKYIHENGVIHSDLKPQNFLLVRGRLKLIDFGISSTINPEMTSVVKNCTIGTLNYISPEALMDTNAGNENSPNHNVDNQKFKITFKSDVWSLGCILYGLVYGETPFQHIRQQYMKISAITNPKHVISFPTTSQSEPVPTVLIDVMRKCLKHDPKARPTVADLLEVHYLQGNVLLPRFSFDILSKIKSALTENEWKEFNQILEKRHQI